MTLEADGGLGQAATQLTDLCRFALAHRPPAHADPCGVEGRLTLREQIHAESAN